MMFCSAEPSILPSMVEAIWQIMQGLVSFMRLPSTAVRASGLAARLPTSGRPAQTNWRPHIRVGTPPNSTQELGSRDSCVPDDAGHLPGRAGSWSLPPAIAVAECGDLYAVHRQYRRWWVAFLSAFPGSQF